MDFSNLFYLKTLTVFLKYVIIFFNIGRKDKIYVHLILIVEVFDV